MDEADLVLSFGYSDDVRAVTKCLPKICQGFLMSATLSAELDDLKRVVLHRCGPVGRGRGVGGGSGGGMPEDVYSGDVCGCGCGWMSLEPEAHFQRVVCGNVYLSRTLVYCCLDLFARRALVCIPRAIYLYVFARVV